MNRPSDGADDAEDRPDQAKGGASQPDGGASQPEGGASHAEGGAARPEDGANRTGGGTKRLARGDLRAAGWAVAAMLVATMAIFLAQRLHAHETRPRTAAPNPARSPSSKPMEPTGCSAAFTVAGAWPTGFQANVTIRTSGSAPISGWTVTWTFPADQTVMQLWNGHFTQTRSVVRVDSEGWNAAPATQTTTFGFVGSGAAPTAVQNLTCTASVASLPRSPSPSHS